MKAILRIVIVLVILTGLAWGYRERVRQADERAARRTEAPPPIRVRTVDVLRREIEDILYATGTIRAVKREYCYFETSGKIVYLHQVSDGPGSDRMRDIREGDRVTKGTLLAQVDPRTLEEELNVEKAALREAEAAQNQARADFERNRSLYEKKVTSQKDFEYYDLQFKRAIEAVNARKAKLKQAEVNLDHSKIVAPCDGVVAYMNVKLGVYFSGESSARSESDVLNWIPFVILHDDEMELTADVPAVYADLVEVGQDAILFRKILDMESPDRFSDAPERVQAAVYSVNPAIDPGGRSVQVKIRTRIQNNDFRDGQFVSCWIIVRRDKEALTIPYNTVLYEDNRPFCFVVEDGIARKRNLKLGIQSIDCLQVRNGLSEGERVVAEGNFRLVDATPVQDLAKRTEPPVSPPAEPAVRNAHE